MGKNNGVLVPDLAKAFDCLSHQLIIAKLNAYSLSLPVLKPIQTYLSIKLQKTQNNDSYSSQNEILFNVLQGSILGPILFIIFLIDLFLVINDVNFARYIDDNTIYDFGASIDSVTTSLQVSAKRLS